MNKDICIIVLIILLIFFIAMFLYEHIKLVKKMAKKNESLEIAQAGMEAAALEARAKTEFVADMSHEIRVPMNAISCATELLVKEKLSPAAKSYINILRTSSDTLLEMVNGILDFSKMDSKHLSFVEREYSFREMIEDVESIVASNITDKSIAFTINIDPLVPQNLLGDEVRIKQILINLLKNSVKYTMKGEINLTVKAEKCDGGTELFFIVSDTGCGITPEEKKKLESAIESNEYVDMNQTPTAMGLLFVNKLAAMMGGSLSFESELSKGSVFRVSVMQKDADNKEVISDSSKDFASDVVVWEDNASYRENLLNILGSINVAVKEIEHALELSSLLSSVKVDYVITTEKHFSDVVDLINKLSPQTVPVKIAEIDEPADTSFDGNFAVLKRPIDIFSVLDIVKTTVYKDMHNAEHVGKLVAPDAKILVVDDNKVNLKVAKALIETFGARVSAVSSGFEALDLIKMGEKFDLIFMDHMMPEMDGIEAAKHIWKLQGEEKTAIIAMTANAGGDVERIFAEAGMTDFVPKPIVMKHLNYVMQKWLPSEKQLFYDNVNVSGNRFLRMHSKAFQPDWGLAKVWNDKKIFLGILSVYTKKGGEIINSIDTDFDFDTALAKCDELHTLSVSIGASRLPDAIKDAMAELSNKNEVLFRNRFEKVREEFVIVCKEVKDYLEGEEEKDFLTFE